MLCTAYTDKGTRKQVNQDSVLIMQGEMAGDEIVFVCICDGMGGLKNGEVASGKAAKALSYWFEDELPCLLRSGLSNDVLKESLNHTIFEIDDAVREYGDDNGECGTTLSGILLYRGRYVCVNVGDSRIYRINETSISQLTKDQTVVQKLMDEGEITEEEASRHRDRNVLLQCIGAGGDVVPVYTYGTYAEGDVFLACSDGFRHKLTGDEIHGIFRQCPGMDKDGINSLLKDAVEANMQRGEKDNISAAVAVAS